MTTTPPPLSGDSSISTWLDHPIGGPILRDMPARAGQDPEVLRPVHRLANKRMVKLSPGSFTTEMLDDLVRRVEAGDVPASTGQTESEAADAARFESPLGAERVRAAMAVMPDAVEADTLAA